MNQPNILILLTDQQRKDSLGCYGNTVTATPNLDRLAARGVRFDNAYVANPICMPSRFSIFTGQNIRNHGQWTNGLQLEEQPNIISELAGRGYQTANIGKIHFTTYRGKDNYESIEYWQKQGTDVGWNGPYWGFEHVELTIHHTMALAHYGKWFYERGGTDEMMRTDKQTGLKTTLPPELHDSTFIAERTVNYLQNVRDRNKPFFLVSSFPDPHHPFDPPAETAARYPLDSVTMPTGSSEDLKTRPDHYARHFCDGWHRKGNIRERHPDGVSEQETRQRIANTAAMVDLIGQNVGKILDELENQGLLENTIIIHTTDHGELLGDHGLWYKGPFYYQGLINIPLIITVSDGLKGVSSQALFSHVDLVPTLCDLLGVSTDLYVNGISQKQVLTGSRQDVREHCLVEYRNGYGDADVSSRALVNKKYKYVYYQTGEEELTDLEKDPMETTSQADNPEYREIKMEMKDKLLREILCTEKKSPEQIGNA